MDAGANASTDPVAVVIAVLPSARDILGGQRGVVGEALGHESSGIMFLARIHVQSPGVDDDHGAFGDKFAVDPVIYDQ